MIVLIKALLNLMCARIHVHAYKHAHASYSCYVPERMDQKQLKYNDNFRCRSSNPFWRSYKDIPRITKKTPLRPKNGVLEPFSWLSIPIMFQGQFVIWMTNLIIHSIMLVDVFLFYSRTVCFVLCHFSYGAVTCVFIIRLHWKDGSFLRC